MAECIDVNDKTGWDEDIDGWYLFYKGKLIANFWLIKLDTVTLLYNIQIMGEHTKSVEFPYGYGNVDRAKAMVEDMVIGYCSDKINELYRIRYAVVKTAGERNEVI